MSHRRGLRRYTGYLFALPYLLLFVGFVVLPLVYGLGLSLFRWEMLSSAPPQFAGTENYREALGDSYFWRALAATLRFVVFAVPLTICFALLIAVGIQSAPRRRQTFYRAAYYLPTVVTISVAGILWRWFYNSEFGLFNAYLANFGLKVPWITDADWAKRGLIPSDSDKVNVMVHLTDTCLDELLAELIEKGTENRIRKTLIIGLRRFKTSYYDTEEKEFIIDEFHKIGSVLGLDITKNLNDWLYGKVLGTIIRLIRKKEVLLSTKSFECTKCKLTLKLGITAIKEGVPDCWIIGQCNQCGEYNLLSTGENAGGLKFDNFTSNEILDSNETSEEQAKSRVEQLIYFRGRN
jgi:hypothetical protein